MVESVVISRAPAMDLNASVHPVIAVNSVNAVSILNIVDRILPFIHEHLWSAQYWYECDSRSVDRETIHLVYCYFVNMSNTTTL